MKTIKKRNWKNIITWIRRERPVDLFPTWSTMRKSYLYNADLSGMNLSGADLTGANLTDANLSGANLADAHLGGAFMFRTNLQNANLTNADLRRAYLRNVNFEGANLHGAKLTTPIGMSSLHEDIASYHGMDSWTSEAWLRSTVGAVIQILAENDRPSALAYLHRMASFAALDDAKDYDMIMLAIKSLAP